jgi:hypothetical protein
MTQQLTEQSNQYGRYAICLTRKTNTTEWQHAHVADQISFTPFFMSQKPSIQQNQIKYSRQDQGDNQDSKFI